MYESVDLSTLTEAKNIYTHNLCKILQPQIYKGIMTILNLCKGTHEPLKNFQKKLEGIPKWNSMIIDDEYNRIIEETKCDYLDNLLDAVFIAHTKILSVINSNSKSSIDITVPNPKKFLHACYIACAYHFFMDPFLFDDTNEDYRKRQKNMKEIFEIIHKCIIETVENLLPINDLLRSCLKKEEKTEQNSYINVFQDMSNDMDNINPNISKDEEEKYPDLDILEGKNLYDAYKNHAQKEVHSEEEINENKKDVKEESDSESDKPNNHLLVSDEQIEQLGQEKIEEKEESESDSESESESESESDELEIENKDKDTLNIKKNEDTLNIKKDKNALNIKKDKVYFFDDI